MCVIFGLTTVDKLKFFYINIFFSQYAAASSCMATLSLRYTAIQFDQKFACNAIVEPGMGRYQNHNNNPHWLKYIYCFAWAIFCVGSTTIYKLEVFHEKVLSILRQLTCTVCRRYRPRLVGLTLRDDPVLISV